MSTSMHRLQISLPHDQMRFLAEQARRGGVSIAEVVRRIVRRELEDAPARGANSLWEIAGIGEDRGPLVGGVPVSEQPDLYVAEAICPSYTQNRKTRRKNHPRRR